MQAALYLASISLIAVTLWDVFITVFSSEGAGPLTRFWSDRLWDGLLWVHRRRPLHRLLSFTGPFILLASIVLWYFLLGLGMFLAFAAQPASVVDNNTGAGVGLLDKLYFVSNTISSLGYGDLVPSGFPWTLASTVATLGATIVLTVSLSYVLSVLSAAIERRKLARAVFGMGTTIPEVVERARLGEPEDSLTSHVLNLAGDIEHQALKHLAYPVLKFFHSTRAELSPARALLLLSDAFFILGNVSGERRPPPGVRRLVESSIGSYVERTSRSIVSPGNRDEHPGLLLDAARVLGDPAPEDPEFRKAFDAYLPRRRRLVALCREDGWGTA